MTCDLPSKIGLLAGGGSLPEALVQACEAQGIDVFIVAFEGQVEDTLCAKGRSHVSLRLGQAEKILSALRREGVEDLVLIGSIRRPSLMELLPDIKGAKIFARIGMKSAGDSDVLSALRVVLEEEGFTLHGAHRFMGGVLTPAGGIGAFSPDEGQMLDIARGVGVVRALGTLDVGQGAIVQEGVVLGVEAAEGTDALIVRCGALQRKGRGGVLVKLCKPQQDEDLDLPTIGPDTVAAAVKAGLSGIAVHAGKSMMAGREELVRLADKYKIFIIGIDPEDYTDE